MLIDAFRGELYKARCNRRQLFWGFLSVPLFLLLFGLVMEIMLPLGRAAADSGLPANPFYKVTRALSIGGNPVAQLFYCIGAASLFAQEYRWETWRLIAARNTRTNLLLAKYGVYLLGVILSLALLLTVSLGTAFYGPLVHGLPSAPPPPNVAQAIAGAFGASFLELATMGALAGLLAVVTRSIMGGVLPVFLLAFGQSLLVGYLAPPPMLNPGLSMPALAGEMLHRWAMPLGGMTVPGDVAAVSAVVLAVWAVAALVVAVVLANAQDLSRE